MYKYILYGTEVWWLRRPLIKFESYNLPAVFAAMIEAMVVKATEVAKAADGRENRFYRTRPLSRRTAT